MKTEKNMTNDQIVFTLILHAGNSKSDSMEALKAAREGNFVLSEEKQRSAEQELTAAHQIQSTMLADFANGEEFPVDILMVHAQDHLNDAITTLDLTKEMVMMYQKIRNMEGKKGE